MKRTCQLVANLPSGAMVWQLVNADQAWGSTEYLLAGAIDVLNQVAWLNSDGKGSPPKPIDRPSAMREKAERERLKQEQFRFQLAKRGITI